MRQLARTVRVGREHHELHRDFAEVLQRAEIRPALRRRNIAVGAAMKNEHWRLDRIHLEERRLADIELRILEWRFAEIIRIEGLAKIYVGPVAEPLDIASAHAGHFVAVRIRDEQAR